MQIKKIANQIIDVIDKDYIKKDKTFSFYMSDKDLKFAPAYIVLRNPKTKNMLTFENYKVDYEDSTEEDIAGYWYKSTSLTDKDGKTTENKTFKLLLIND